MQLEKFPYFPMSVCYRVCSNAQSVFCDGTWPGVIFVLGKNNEGVVFLWKDEDAIGGQRVEPVISKTMDILCGKH